MVVVGQPVEGAHRLQDPEVLGAHALEQDGDPPPLEVVDDVAEGVGGRGVEALDVGEPQDDHPHVPDRGELLEEPLGHGEEERAVDPVDEHVVVDRPEPVDVVAVGRRSSPDRRSDVKVALRARWRRASPPATARPSSMATMRLTATVATAVSTSTAASDRVERSTDHTFDGSTIRTAVTMSTPARAASGILATRDPATSTTARRVSECTTAERRVRAPARALTAVRAMARSRACPPNIDEASEARPWPTSSRSGSLGRPSVRASATLADRSDSMAASTATARAAEASCGTRPRAGARGTGNDDGSAPMRVTVQPGHPGHHGGHDHAEEGRRQGAVEAG